MDKGRPSGLDGADKIAKTVESHLEFFKVKLVEFHKGETGPEAILKKGKLLNQVLLDKGLAVKVE
jgi:hypothetical protein